MTICSQNLNVNERAKLERMRQEDPEFDKEFARTVKESIAAVGGGRRGTLQRRIDDETRLLINPPTPGPGPTGRRPRPRRRHR